MEQEKKMYSQKAIGIATYLGGPLAAGILIRKNYINLGEEKKGLQTLIISTVSTVFLFAGILSIPENIIDKVPNAVIPAVYSGIIYLIVEKLQGNQLKAYEQAKGIFYSAWNAAGIGLLSGVIIAATIFGYVYLEEGDWDVDSYNAKIELHAVNEETAMKLFELLELAPKEQILEFINQTGIPKWKENLVTLKSISQIENIPEEYAHQAELLVEYTTLRIEAYELIAKAVESESSAYDSEIQKRHMRIDEIIAAL